MYIWIYPPAEKKLFSFMCSKHTDGWSCNVHLLIIEEVTRGMEEETVQGHFLVAGGVLFNITPGLLAFCSLFSMVI